VGKHTLKASFRGVFQRKNSGVVEGSTTTTAAISSGALSSIKTVSRRWRMFANRSEWSFRCVHCHKVLSHFSGAKREREREENGSDRRVQIDSFGQGVGGGVERGEGEGRAKRRDWDLRGVQVRQERGEHQLGLGTKTEFFVCVCVGIQSRRWSFM
jgi:hypothetical protein